MNLEVKMLSEIGQAQEDKYCTIPLTRGISNSQIYKNKEWDIDCWELGKGKGSY